jgi:hypothetical protein
MVYILAREPHGLLYPIGYTCNEQRVCFDELLSPHESPGNHQETPTRARRS